MERTRTHNLAVGSVCKLRAETLPTQPPRQHLHVARAGRVRVLKVRELGGNGNIYLGNGTETGRMYAETDRDGNSGLSPYPYSYLISGRQIDCPGASSPRIWPTDW